MNAKAFWKSRTLWFNGGVLVLAAAETQLHVLSAVLPASLFAWLAFLVPLVNAALRFTTSAMLTPTVAGAQAINSGRVTVPAPLASPVPPTPPADTPP